MNLTEDEAAILLKSLAPKLRQPGDIDRQQAAEAWGLSVSSAGERLIRLVKEGELVDGGIVWDPVSHRRMRVYRKA